MATKVYRDEEVFDGLDKSSSSTYYDEQKLPEIVPTDYLDTANEGTRRASNVLSDSLSLGGSTVVVENTAQLQQAINNIVSTGGGKLFLKKGTYIINSAILGGSPLEIEGESFKNTIIDFGGTSANLSFLGTEIYTTGTVTAVTSGVTVTGSGTSWLSITNPSEKQIFLGTRWYKIASVTNDTTLVLAEGYGDDVVVPAGITYRIAKIQTDIRLSNLTIKGSSGDGLVFTDCRDVELEDVYVTLNSGNGVNFTNVMGITTQRLTLVANGLYGFKCTNSGYGNWVSIPSIANGWAGTGGGFYLENLKTIPWTSSAADANTGNGVTMKDCQDVFMTIESMGNSAIGIEQVSGNDNIVMAGGIVSGNGSDGIKLTATSDNFKIGGSSITDNTGEGINIAAATCDNTVITGNSFSGNGGITGGVDNGTNTVIRGNVGWADNENFSYTQFFFGGDGSDGVGVADGSTALAGATLSGGNYTLTREVYYTNLTISNGVTVYPAGMRIFCTGTLAVNGKISRNGNSGTYNSNQNEGTNDGNHGQPGQGGAALADGYLKGSLAGPNGATGTSNAPGAAGTNGSNTSNSIGTNGVAGGKGGNSSSYSGGAASTGGTATQSITKLSANWNYQSMLDVSTTGSTVKYDNSASAGSGGSGSEISGARLSAGGGGAGSAGGIIAIYAKEIIIGATGVIEANGGNGGAGGNAVVGGNGGGGGGGGGGNGGQIILAYTSLTNNGSITVTGGTGGSAGYNDWGAGGATAGTNGTAGTIRYFSFT